VILAFAISLALGAADATVTLPPWPLSPDGELIAVSGDLVPSIEGGSAEREGGSVWRVRPEPGSEKVRIRAGSALVEAAVAAPPGRILVTADPAAPVKGQDRQVHLRFDVVDPRGEPLALASPPVVSASVGRMGVLEPGGPPGRYVATWEPSGSPQPEVLGIVAIAPRCPLCASPLALGVARLPVAAAINLPGRSDPGVATRVEVAGRTWGPVRSDADGRFSIPVVVPPGSRWASASSMSAAGNERRSKIDLQLSESPGLHCAAWPQRVAGDGRTEVGLHCVAWTAAGGALDPAPLKGTAERGKVRWQRSDGVAWSARYVPAVAATGSDAIVVALGPTPAPRADLRIGLETGAPASIAWEVDGEPAVPGARLRASARALDALGAELGEAVSVDGAFSGGVLQARPAFGDGQQRLTLRYVLPAGGPAATLSLHRAGGEWIAVARDVAARPVAGVDVRCGDGAGGTTDVRGEVRCASRGEVQTATAPGGLRAAGWAAAPLPVPPVAVEREVTLSLRPAGGVDVAAELQGRWIRWRILSPDGEPLAGREVSVASGSVELGPIEAADRGGRCAVRSGSGTVAITDEESGATALVEVR
jgi:hypothetical protein